jgi:alpha/beta superfamily hydrolase
MEESVTLDSPRGELAGVLAYPLAGKPEIAALIVGPHPLMGGRLSNNVVRHVGRGLAESGLLTLRFAFAGGGPTSEVMEQFWQTGRAPEDPHRSEEVRSAWLWLAERHRGPAVLVGYSFGASLLGELLDDERVRGVVMIGATLLQHDYGRLARACMPKLLLAADNDFATPLSASQTWFAAAEKPKTLIVVPAAEHFYRDQEDRIVQEIVAWLPR